MQIVCCSREASTLGLSSPQSEAYIEQTSPIIFVDPNIESLSSLVYATRSNSNAIYLNRMLNGFDQMLLHLEGRARLSSIHLMADIVRGQLVLCGRRYGLRELRERRAELAQLGQALAPSGELIIGASGTHDWLSGYFRQLLADLTAAPVRLWSGCGAELAANI
jgi:Domain of unknown function (DUF4347)